MIIAEDLKMKVAVKDITSQGIHLHKKISPETIGLTDDEVRYVSSLDVHADLQKIGKTIVMISEITGTFCFECARCLEPLKQEYTCKFNCDFEYDPTVEFINLGEEIRQELILSNYPIVLCKEDCKGLCPKCGVNLNLEKCQCQK